MAEPQLSPGAWLEFLERKLDEQWASCKIYEDYFNGEHRLTFAVQKFREVFARYFGPLATNWCKLICNVPVARLKVMGFRLNPDMTKAAWDREADADAWRIWQANSLDAGSRQAHLTAIVCGLSYVLVSPAQREGAEPLITIEHPEQCYVFESAATRERLAGFKRWVDEIDGHAYCTIYLPDVLHKFISVDPVKVGKRVQWVRRANPEANPIGVVPLICLPNVPDLKWGGRSDLEEVVPVQDMINKLALDCILAAEHHAAPQRWATGWERATGPDGKELTGRDVEIAMGTSRLVRAESNDTTFGSFPVGDAAQFLGPIAMLVDTLSSISSTPAYYFAGGKISNISAEALIAMDSGLVDRSRAKIDGGFSDTWEEVMRTAFLAKDDQERGTAVMAETIWAAVETRSIAQVTDAAVKQRAELSVPLEMIWEMLGWSPQQIQQAKQLMNLPESPAAAAAAAKELPPATPAAALAANGAASGA